MMTLKVWPPNSNISVSWGLLAIHLLEPHLKPIGSETGVGPGNLDLTNLPDDSDAHLDLRASGLESDRYPSVREVTLSASLRTKVPGGLAFGASYCLLHPMPRTALGTQ